LFCPLIFQWSLIRPITYFYGIVSLYYHAGRNNRALTTCTLLVHTKTGIMGIKSPSYHACIFAAFLCLCYPVYVVILRRAHPPSMDRPCSSTKCLWARFINPVNGKLSATPRQRYSCRYVPSKNTTVPQYFSRYKDILFTIQYVRTTAWLLCIQGTIGAFLERTLYVRSRVLIVDFLILQITCRNWSKGMNMCVHMYVKKFWSSAEKLIL
jgi:hypothetical protein